MAASRSSSGVHRPSKPPNSVGAVKWIAFGAESDFARPVRPDVHHAATRYACSSLIVPHISMEVFVLHNTMMHRAHFSPHAGKTALSRTFRATNATFSFNPRDLGAQPAGQGLLDLYLIPRAIQIFQCLSIIGKRNEPAGNRIASLLLGNELRQQAALTGMGVRRIAKIWANRRVLENRRCPPGRPGRTTVTSIQQEIQFEFKNFQNVATVLRHRSPRCMAGCQKFADHSVYFITGESDSDHTRAARLPQSHL